MPRNVEIKARLGNADEIRCRAAELTGGAPVEIYQDNTFFPCTVGRLKLRMFSESEGELIFYQRADEAAPKESFYLRSPTNDPVALRQSLSLAYGSIGQVKKHRTLYISGRTRIHIDEVQGLGSYLELEVVLEDSEGVADGVSEANELMQQLGIDPSQLVQGAYVDLINDNDI